MNSLANPNALTLGQKLQIPAKGAAGATAGSSSGGSASGGAAAGSSAAGGTATYAVQKGDTLGSIAKKFGTTVSEIQRLNNISNPNVLALGQKLIVPGSGGGASSGAGTAPTSGQGKSYVVQRGDTMLTIARRFGLTVKQLQTANNISNPDKIFPGQKLVIP